jgi:hypothetical protein
VVTFGCWALTLFCSELDGEKWSGGSAVTREKGWEEEEGTNLLGSVDFVRERPQVQATPARNSASLAARSAGEGKGGWRGGVGNL